MLKLNIWKCLFAALLVMSAGLNHCDLLADEPPKVDPNAVNPDSIDYETANSETVDPNAIDYQSVQTELEELILSRASNFDDPQHRTYIQLANQIGKKDRRITEAVFRVLSNSDLALRNGEHQIVNAIQLLQNCEATDQEIAAVCFKSWDSAKRHYRNFPSIDSLESQVVSRPAPAKKLIVEQIERGTVAVHHVQMLSKVCDSNEFVRLIRELPHSKDKQLAAAATQQLWSTLRVEQARRQLERESPNGKKPSAKYLFYAKRIFDRNDSNKNGFIDVVEIKKMLMKPIGADLTGDGLISLDEYALYIQRNDEGK